MSAEIKFRALRDDMSNCNFVYGDLIYGIDGTPRILIDRRQLLLVSCIRGTEGQFTGLKDKNGKEIYIGDIVATRYTGGNAKGNIFKQAEVKFGNYDIGCNGYEYSFTVSGFYVEDEYLYGIIVNGEGEIIGNVHENAELLNQDKE